MFIECMRLTARNRAKENKSEERVNFQVIPLNHALNQKTERNFHPLEFGLG